MIEVIYIFTEIDVIYRHPVVDAKKTFPIIDVSSIVMVDLIDRCPEHIVIVSKDFLSDCRVSSTPETRNAKTSFIESEKSI